MGSHGKGPLITISLTRIALQVFCFLEQVKAFVS